MAGFATWFVQTELPSHRIRFEAAYFTEQDSIIYYDQICECKQSFCQTGAFR